LFYGLGLTRAGVLLLAGSNCYVIGL